ncbi:MAG: hypothetical protein LC794_20070 [Acidobacteria bacterium]|nr:hypothetical protein [Acidobacteriota bacterium]
MINIRPKKRWPVWLSITLLVVMGFAGLAPPPTSTVASNSPTLGDNAPPFDFSDAFYRENGIVPANIGERAGNPDRNPAHWTVDNSNTDPTRRNIRILETTGGWDNSGNLIYYSIMGTLMPNSFERDANGNLTDRGRRAMDVANRFRAFLFPKTQRDANNNPVFVKSPAPPNRRQDNVFDTRNGYFSNNPLGNWILAFVVYTSRAFTPAGKTRLDAIAAKNGRDLDGTPILQTASDIDNLVAEGFAMIVNRLNGSEGFPWVI